MSDLVPTTTQSWRPREEKTIRLVTTSVFALGGISVGAVLITKFVPSWVAAVDLLTKLTGSMINLGVTAIALAALGWLGLETFTPSGKINKLFNQWYSSFTLKLTYELLNVDPISPLTDKRREMVARAAEFSDQFAKFDGTISQLAAQRDKFAKQARDAEADAKEANRQSQEYRAKGNNAKADELTQTFKNLSYDYGSFNGTAIEFGNMIQKLIPVREHIKDLRTATEFVIKRLDTDIVSLKARWEAKRSMESMGAAAKKILSGSDKEELAADAQALIEQQYAEQIGQLANLAEKTQPLIQSIDMKTGRVSNELLEKWEAETRQAIPVVVTAQISDQNNNAMLNTLLR